MVRCRLVFDCFVVIFFICVVFCQLMEALCFANFCSDRERFCIWVISGPLMVARVFDGQPLLGS